MLLSLLFLFPSMAFAAEPAPESPAPETAGGWVKYEHNPILGGDLGTCFDISVLKDEGKYRMWVSWRPKGSIALVESTNGYDFSKTPVIVLKPVPNTWEGDVNRPVIIKLRDGYHQWYTGQSKDHSAIGYATSPDGVTWKRMSTEPVLKPEESWEKVALMCPDVMWDNHTKEFRMWYSGGEQFEPNAIGYATSKDGLHWKKSPLNPVFQADPKTKWEQERVTACHVVKQGGWYYMFYIGFRDIGHAQIGVARSKEGINHWERLPQNPIVRTGAGKWDNDACYKPYTVFDGSKWFLWYNGRTKALEQIGVVTHASADLGFGAAK